MSMESGLKQRLIGAAVLVALAVIFLPMLVKGPAPDSGVADVPLSVPDAPTGDFVTRDLPLVVPDEAPAGGVTGLPAPMPLENSGATLPTVDTASSPPGARQDAASPDDAADANQPMLPATVAGGDYAVHFGAYDSSVSADTVVSRLRAAQLPAYRDNVTVNGKPAWRVRIGTYASRADAETARLRANTVGRSNASRVIALDADAAAPAGASIAPASAVTSAPAAPTKPSPPPEKPEAAPKPAAAEAKPAPAPAKAATADIGFAVQLGAFSSAAQATAKRDQLRSAGFSAFTETVNTDKGTLTRVLAGPVLSRPEAESLKAQVKAKLGTDGLVRSHP